MTNCNVWGLLELRTWGWFSQHQWVCHRIGIEGKAHHSASNSTCETAGCLKLYSEQALLAWLYCKLNHCFLTAWPCGYLKYPYKTAVAGDRWLLCELLLWTGSVSKHVIGSLNGFCCWFMTIILVHWVRPYDNAQGPCIAMCIISAIWNSPYIAIEDKLGSFVAFVSKS